MNTSKFIVSGIAGGVAAFFGGYLIYGVLLMDFMSKNAGPATNVMRGETEMVWWALMAGNLFMGLLISYIFNRWASIVTFGKGLGGGATIGLLSCLASGLTMYGTSNIHTLNSLGVDIIAGTVLTAIVGGVVGLVNGLGKKQSA